MSNEPPGRAKRTDVGYKRPPVETRFQKGQKPPPRKRKKEPVELSFQDLLWKILSEQKRVIVDGAPKWMRASEIIVHNAYLLADKGNPTLVRLIGDSLMEVDFKGREKDEMPEIVLAPDEPTGIIHLTQRLE